MNIQEEKQNEITQQQVAENLIYPLFRCIDEEYKSKYYRELWDQIENSIRSASYCSRLPQFYQNFLKKIPTYPQQKYMAQIRSVVDCGLDKTVLTWLREETSYIMLLARMLNEDRKQQFKKEE